MQTLLISVEIWYHIKMLKTTSILASLTQLPSFYSPIAHMGWDLIVIEFTSYLYKEKYD